MAGVLEGITVLDLAQNWAGPGVSMYLADQGAEVIKIEPPGGDAARGWGVSPVLQGTSKSFLAINRNKRSIAIDLKTAEGLQLFYDLVKKADVLVLNVRPVVATRLGIGYEKLAEINPRLVYAAVLGYGDKGEYAPRPAYDSIAQGMSGASHRLLPDGAPIATGIFAADCSAPMILAYGVMCALFAREKTGKGQKVETSLLAAAVAMQSVELVKIEAEPPQPKDETAASPSYKCADGKYINVAPLTEKQVIALVEVLDMGWILGTPEYLAENRNITGLMRNWRDDMQAAFLQRPAQEWLDLINAADVPCGPVLTRDEVFDDEQLLVNEAIVPMDHPYAGPIKILGIPVRLSDNPGSIRLPAPSLGEHTEQIVRELGYSDEQVAELYARGAVV